MGLMIPANGRLVVTVRTALGFDGRDRGSATVNVAAPTRDIDVMTIQRSPFTDEVDTTLYQHAGSGDSPGAAPNGRQLGTRNHPPRMRQVAS